MRPMGCLEGVIHICAEKSRCRGGGGRTELPCSALKAEFPRLVLRLRLDTPSHTSSLALDGARGENACLD